MKTVVLHHSQSCAKPTNDVIDCLREMLQELLQAYESGELKQFTTFTTQSRKDRQNHKTNCDAHKNT